MNGLRTFDASIISFIILLVIFSHAYTRSEKQMAQHKLFYVLLLLNMSMIIIDLCGWIFNGLSGIQYVILNTGFNMLLYIGAPSVPTVWVLYICYLTNCDAKRIKRVGIVVLSLFAINACLSIISVFTGWFFYIDASNLYHRGSLYPEHLIYCQFLLAYSLFLFVSKRSLFHRRQFFSILIFFLAPLIGMIIQALNYGVSYNWVGVTISLLIIYFYLQSRNLNTDFLTGVNNRLHFQAYLNEKIHSSSDKKTFGAIMIDIDQFKSINDTYGHASGDEALKDAVNIFQSALRKDDFIARFGGDEFLIIIDVQDLKILERAILRIKEKTRLFNDVENRPYQLSFSFGYQIYDALANLGTDDFIDQLDQLMYEDKHSKRSLNFEKQIKPANPSPSQNRKKKLPDM